GWSPGITIAWAPCHGTGTRYKLRCTLLRVKAYISAVGPGATSLAGITRTPGSFKISCSDVSPWTIVSGTKWPGANGKTYALSKLFAVIPRTNKCFPSPDHSSHVGGGSCVTSGAPPSTRKITIGCEPNRIKLRSGDLPIKA